MADEAEKMEEDRATRIFSVEDNQQETDDEKLERQYFWKVVEAFLYYKWVHLVLLFYNIS